MPRPQRQPSRCSWKLRAYSGRPIWGAPHAARISETWRNCGKRPRRERLRLLKPYSSLALDGRELLQPCSFGWPGIISASPGLSGLLLGVLADSWTAPGFPWLSWELRLGQPNLANKSRRPPDLQSKVRKRPSGSRLRLQKPYLPQRKMAGNFFHSRQRADLSDFRSLGGRQTRFRVEIPDFPATQMNHFWVVLGTSWALLAAPGRPGRLLDCSWLLLALLGAPARTAEFRGHFAKKSRRSPGLPPKVRKRPSGSRLRLQKPYLLPEDGRELFSFAPASRFERF